MPIFGFNDFNSKTTPANNKSKGIFGFNDFNKSPQKYLDIKKKDNGSTNTKSNIHGFDFKTKATKKPILKKKDSPVKTKAVENDQDYLLALQLSTQFQNEEPNSKLFSPQKFQSPNKNRQIVVAPEIPLSLRGDHLGDPQYDLIDPCPDIHALFIEYNKKYFWNTLGSCIVEWSKRMTICAGIFYLRGGGTIRLSEQLLQYRPRKDLVETLLHEMIHAYLYLTRNFKVNELCFARKCAKFREKTLLNFGN